MPSVNKTENYNLNQYLGTESQKRVDYNDDMLKIDTALKDLEDNKADKIDYIPNTVKTTTGEANKIPVLDANGKLILKGAQQKITVTTLAQLGLNDNNFNGTLNEALALINTALGNIGYSQLDLYLTSVSSPKLYALLTNGIDFSGGIFTFEKLGHGFLMLKPSNDSSEVYFSSFENVSGFKGWESFRKIVKSSTAALDIKNDSSTSVFTVDTISGEIAGSSTSVLEIARKLVKRDNNGKIAGLENVTNTSDTDKPISTAQQTALDLKYNSADMVTTATPNKGVKRDSNGFIPGVTNVIEVKAVGRTSTIPTTLDPVDSYTPVVGDSILFASYGGGVADGVYVVQPNGTAWTRSPLHDSEAKILWTKIKVTSGSAYKNTLFECTTEQLIMVGLSPIKIAQVELSAVVGQVTYISHNTVPRGYLKANGAAVSRTTYARLFSAIGVTFGSGDGVNTFNLPDLRGEFVRGWDDSRGVDSGRVLGSYQGDAIRNITGILASLSSIGLGPFTSQGGALFSGDVTTTLGGASGTSTARMGSIQFDANRQVPTASENRPRNIALMPIIKY